MCIVLAVMSTAAAQAQTQIQENHAATLFINARVYTADASRPSAEAFAVNEGRILAVGGIDEMLGYQGPATTVVDLQGRRVLPGLIDAHTHAVIAGLAALSPNLHDAELDALAVEQQARGWLNDSPNGLPPALVIFGVNPGTWDDPQALSHVFDAGVWASQPLFLMGSDLHTGWVNRAMREQAGIDAQYVSELPATLRHTIGVGSKGEPNGILIDAGVDRVTLQLPKPDAATLLEAGRVAVRTKNQHGITAWMDAAANAGPGEALFWRAPGSTGTGILPAYRELAQAGELTAHVAALLVASPQAGANELNALASVREAFSDIPNLTLPGIKIFADGVLEYPAQSAALLGQYRNSGEQGEMLLQRSVMQAVVDAADARGWMVHIHALGDRAVRQSLDAFEAARRQRASGVPHSITHLQLVHPDDYPRFQALGVMAVMQLHWAEMDNYLLDLVKPYITDQAFQGQYPARSLLEHGAVIAGASDWPISTPNPWEAMHHGMTRDGPEGGLNAAERMDRNDMLLAYTRHAAQAIGLGAKIGSLSPGKQADFIVVDRDVLEVDLDAFKNTRVLATYFAGEKVYSGE